MQNKNSLSLSDQHKQAVELHQKILISASLAQQNLWDMCSGLKQMRDGKLYKELGYQNFEDYCETEVGMKRRNVYNYISIVENVKNVQSIAQIGMTKLSLLATISGEQQHELSEKVNLEETTVKQLKAEIDKLKNEQKNYEQLVEDINADKQRLEKELNEAKNVGNKKAVKELEEKINTLKERNARLMTKVDEAEQRAENSRKSETKAYGRVSILETDNELYKKKIEQLEAENKKKGEDIISLESTVKELESRPVEVAVVDNSAENDRKLNEVIRSLERENMKRNEELDRQYIEDRRKLEADKQREIAALREEYEKKLAEAEAPQPEPVDEDKLKFKIYLTSTFDMLNRLTEFTSQHSDPIYKEKIKQLLNSVLEKMEE